MINDQFKKDFNIIENNILYNLLFSISYAVNIPTSFLGGKFSDKIGIKLSILLFSIIILTA
jgi:hypothetical protein